jgi:hypothetical protein
VEDIMKIQSLVAAQGESFTFSDEDGIQWEGKCIRLLPYSDRTQLEVEVTEGPEKYKGKVVIFVFNPENGEIIIEQVS